MANAFGMSAFSSYAMQFPGSATNTILDASNEKIGFVFQAEADEAITGIGFRYGVRVGSGSDLPPVYNVVLQGVSPAGAPDGTDIGGGSPTAVTFQGPADSSIDGLWQRVTLTNPYTPTGRPWLSLVIEYSSGTISGTNYSSFTRALALTQGFDSGAPYSLLNTGSWVTSGAGVCFSIETASRRYGFPIQAAYSTNTAAISGRRAMMYFTLPSGHGDTFKVAGVRGVMLAHTASGSSKLVLTDTSGTVLQEATIDGDHVATAGTRAQQQLFADTTLATLSYGTKYYIGIQANSAHAVGMRGFKLGSAEDRQCYANGANRGLVMFDGSTYTEDDTVLPLLDLILADVTEPAGGSNAYVIGG